MRKVSKLLNQGHPLCSHQIDFMNSDMHVDSVGKSLPMPHNEDAAEHEDMVEHSEDATQALSPSLTHGAEVAASDGEREQSCSAPTTLEHHQMVLSFGSSQPASTPALTFSHPASMTIQMRKESMQCTLCIQALCKCCFECNGHINWAWCKCNHPLLVGKKKVRWLEVEVTCRIALLEAGQGSSHMWYKRNRGVLRTMDYIHVQYIGGADIGRLAQQVRTRDDQKIIETHHEKWLPGAHHH